MRKDYEKLFTHLEPPEPPTGLFDKIILAIQREQELQRTKRLVFGFFSLLIISFAAVPFSWSMLVGQMENSAILYFLSIAASDVRIFFALRQDFILAILESLPTIGITLFTVNMILVVFTIRLFLYKRRLLMGYILHNS